MKKKIIFFIVPTIFMATSLLAPLFAPPKAAKTPTTPLIDRNEFDQHAWNGTLDKVIRTFNVPLERILQNIQQLQNLKHIVFSSEIHGFVPHLEIAKLDQILPGSNVTHLTFSRRALSLPGLMTLANVLIHHKIHSLNISDNDFDENTETALLQLITGNNITCLNYAGNLISEKIIVILKSFFEKSNCSIKEISLDTNHYSISDIQAESFAQCCKKYGITLHT